MLLGENVGTAQVGSFLPLQTHGKVTTSLIYFVI